MKNQILYMVKQGNLCFIVWAFNSENAKVKARDWLRGNPEDYNITPLTELGDRVAFGMMVST